MPFNILAHIKMEIKAIQKIVDIPRLYGPLATVTATVIYHLGSLYFGYSIAVFSLAPFLALASVLGLRSGLICAAWLSAYAWYAIPSDPARIIQIWIGLFLIAIIVGSETRALRQALAEAQAGVEARRMVDNLNGNIIRVEEARLSLLSILEANRLDEPTRNRLRSVLHTLNNLALATQGWKELRDLKADIERARTQPLEGGSDAVE